MIPAEAFGPWATDIDSAERLARMRAMRALANFFAIAFQASATRFGGLNQTRLHSSRHCSCCSTSFPRSTAGGS